VGETKEFNVLVAGVGGQGNVLAAHVIAEAAMLEGFRVRVGETFGMSQKGGAVVSHVRIGSEVFSPLVPSRMGDLIIGLEPIETLRVAVDYSSPQCSIFFNTIPSIPVSVNVGKCPYPSVDAIVAILKQLGKNVAATDALSLAKETGQPRTLNMVMLGFSVGSNIFAIASGTFRRAIKNVVKPKWVESNVRAFEVGEKAFSDRSARN